MDKTKREKRIKLGIVNFLIVIFILMTTIVIFCIYNLVTSERTPDYVFTISHKSTTYLDQNKAGETKVGGVTLSDKDVVWSGHTKVNIFEHNDPNVKSDGTGKADHVVAPGTKNDYVFSIANSFNKEVKYHLEITGGNDSTYSIPVELEIVDDSGKTLTNGKVLIKDLPEIVTTGYVDAQKAKNFSINWEWPFENGTDQYDTLLGNKAADEEIACHLNINVVAELEDEPAPPVDDTSKPNSKPDDHSDKTSKPASDQNDSDKPVITGDSTNTFVVYLVVILALSACTAIIVVLTTKKKKDTDEDY